MEKFLILSIPIAAGFILSIVHIKTRSLAKKYHRVCQIQFEKIYSIEQMCTVPYVRIKQRQHNSGIPFSSKKLLKDQAYCDTPYKDFILLGGSSNEPFINY